MGCLATFCATGRDAAGRQDDCTDLIVAKVVDPGGIYGRQSGAWLISP
jgi:hypothetical protein